MDECSRTLSSCFSKVQGDQDVGVAVAALRLLQGPSHLEQGRHARTVVVEAFGNEKLLHRRYMIQTLGS